MQKEYGTDLCKCELLYRPIKKKTAYEIVYRYLQCLNVSLGAVHDYIHRFERAFQSVSPNTIYPKFYGQTEKCNVFSTETIVCQKRI